MAELVTAGLFTRDFPPDSGDHIGLEIGDQVSDFCVYRVRGEFHCEEVDRANPRRLRYTEEELTMHRLERLPFYQVMAADLTLTGQPAELANGIWEIGRKRLQGRDASKVLFIEHGTPTETLELTVMRDSFSALCLLSHATPPRHDWHSGKTLVAGVIEVRDGRFATDVFEDLSASQRETSANTRIELDERQPTLWICGEEFSLPTTSEGMPTDGCRYLAYLFDHVEKPISCWDLYLEIRPEEKDKIGGPSWSDNVLDDRALPEFKASLKEAQAELKEAESDPSTPPTELEQLRSKVDDLREQAAKLLNRSGKSRQIVEGDRGKARQRVRKALKVVVDKITDQGAAIGSALAEALGEGETVLFHPPPDWRL